MKHEIRNDYTLSVSVSTSNFIEKPKTAVEKSKYFHNVRWEKQSITLLELERFIKEGRSFCYCFQVTNPFGAAQKTKDNFDSTSLITLDIDDSTVPMEQYVNQLPFKPTLYHTTCSNGVKGYRFRLMYVFDKPFEGIQNYTMGYNCLLYSLGIELKDNCMQSANQFFYGNPYTNCECVITNYIYSYPEWINSCTQAAPLQSMATTAGYQVDSFSSPLPQLHLNETFLRDYSTLTLRVFLDKYSCDYPLSPSESPLIAADERYYTFPEHYYTLPRKRRGAFVCKWKDGEQRHKKLFVAGMVFQKLIADIQPEHLLYLLVNEFYFYYDNSDNRFNRGDILQLLYDIINSDYEIQPSEHGKFRINKEWCRENGISPNTMANTISKEFRYAEIGVFYQENLTIKQNIAILKENGISVSRCTLLRYKKWKNNLEFSIGETDRTDNNNIVQSVLSRE